MPTKSNNRLHEFQKKKPAKLASPTIKLTPEELAKKRRGLDRLKALYSKKKPYLTNPNNPNKVNVSKSIGSTSLVGGNLSVLAKNKAILKKTIKVVDASYAESKVNEAFGSLENLVTFIFASYPEYFNELIPLEAKAKKLNLEYAVLLHIKIHSQAFNRLLRKAHLSLSWNSNTHIEEVIGIANNRSSLKVTPKDVLNAGAYLMDYEGLPIEDESTKSSKGTTIVFDFGGMNPNEFLYGKQTKRNIGFAKQVDSKSTLELDDPSIIEANFKDVSNDGQNTINGSDEKSKWVQTESAERDRLIDDSRSTGDVDSQDTGGKVLQEGNEVSDNPNVPNSPEYPDKFSEVSGFRNLPIAGQIPIQEKGISDSLLLKHAKNEHRMSQGSSKTSQKPVTVLSGLSERIVKKIPDEYGHTGNKPTKLSDSPYQSISEKVAQAIEQRRNAKQDKPNSEEGNKFKNIKSSFS
jgi:hypothetical protein